MHRTKLLTFIFLILFSSFISPTQSIDNGIENISADESFEQKSEQSYIEMAKGYINDRNYKLARQYILLAENSGDETMFQEAQVWKIYIEALTGQKNIEASVNVLTGDFNGKALYYASDGWQNYFENNPEAKDLFNMSLDYKEKLILQHPDSEWALMASMQLTTIYISDRDYDKALYYLMKYMDKQKSQGELNGKYDDKAWFYLGEILENSKEYRDLHKAAKAYSNVLKSENSVFRQVAKKRIMALEKFFHVSP